MPCHTVPDMVHVFIHVVRVRPWDNVATLVSLMIVGLQIGVEKFVNLVHLRLSDVVQYFVLARFSIDSFFSNVHVVGS